ncbi:transmembrane protease serine 9 [Drosophila biarmipes]|uniref:transmembrane protease serine 9 n=1 Tax=Drosophila biarmipes TaxID=125945 RepID=UPI0007E71B01|nr:transmembrane protease serine 9 [Drosophila biarmipes]
MTWLVFPLLLVGFPGITFGDPDFQNRIIGGYYVDIADAPYQAEVIIDGTAICSGAIIKPQFILTAASCVSEYYSSVQVRVDTNSRDYDGTGTLVGVCNIISHRGYNYWRFDNNLALLKLCEPLKTSKTVKPISLAEELPADYSWCVVSGWGSTSWWGSWWDRCFGSLPDYLQMVWVSVYNREQCAVDRGVWFGLWDNGISQLTLCTQYGAGGCSYDTGAPLVRNGYLVGILSEGGCSKKPDVYASLTWFRNWIADNTAEDDTTTPASSTSVSTPGPTSSSIGSSSTSVTPSIPESSSSTKLTPTSTSVTTNTPGIPSSPSRIPETTSGTKTSLSSTISSSTETTPPSTTLSPTSTPKATASTTSISPTNTPTTKVSPTSTPETTAGSTVSSSTETTPPSTISSPTDTTSTPSTTALPTSSPESTAGTETTSSSIPTTIPSSPDTTNTLSTTVSPATRLPMCTGAEENITPRPVIP